MQNTNDHRLTADVHGAASPPGCPENDAGLSSHIADSADGAGWESAWIDLGGEG